MFKFSYFFFILGGEDGGAALTLTLGAKAGEVLLVNSDRSSTTVTAARSVTTASTSTATTTTATTAATTGTVAAGSLDKASVDIEEGLLLALLGGLALLLLALDVFVALLVTLQFLGAGPLVVTLGALVGGTDGLGAEVTLGSLLGEVVGERLGLVGRLLGLLLGGSLGLGLLGLGQLLTGLLVVEFLLAALAAPALVDLLARVAKHIKLLVASLFHSSSVILPREVVVLLRHTTAVLAVVAGPSTTVITGVETASLRLVALISRSVTVVAGAGVAVTVS